MREFAHRTREDTTSTVVRVQARSSAEAIEQLCSSIPEDHVILYILDAS